MRRQVAEAAATEPDPHTAHTGASPHVPQRQGQVSLHGLHLRVEFPYDPELVRRIKALWQTYGGPGFQHDASSKYWLLAQSAAEVIAEHLPQLVWTPEAEAVQHRRAQQRMALEQLPPHFR